MLWLQVRHRLSSRFLWTAAFTCPSPSSQGTRHRLIRHSLKSCRMHSSATTKKLARLPWFKSFTSRSSFRKHSLALTLPALRRKNTESGRKRFRRSWNSKCEKWPRSKFKASVNGKSLQLQRAVHFLRTSRPRNWKRLNSRRSRTRRIRTCNSWWSDSRRWDQPKKRK